MGHTKTPDEIYINPCTKNAGIWNTYDTLLGGEKESAVKYIRADHSQQTIKDLVAALEIIAQRFEERDSSGAKHECAEFVLHHAYKALKAAQTAQPPIEQQGE